MSRYLNSPREADWYACPSCGDEVRVGSSGCQRCNEKGADLEQDAPDTDLYLADSASDFDYADWKKREFGGASRFKPHHLSWKWWVVGIVLILAMLWGAVFTGFLSH